MYALKELLDVMGFKQRMIRREGCFGSPYSGSDQTYSELPKPKAGEPVAVFDAFRDPETGEVLYRNRD